MNTPLTLINIGLARHDGDWNWQHVRSPFARIYYVTEGTAQVLLPDTTLDLHPGRLYLIPPFTTHHYSCTGHFAHYYIHLYEETSLGEDGQFDWFEMTHEAVAMPTDLILIERLASLLPHLKLQASDPKTYDNNTMLMERIRQSHHRQLYERTEIQGILLILLSRFLNQAHEKHPTKDSRIIRAMRFISRNNDIHISLDKLATEACLSKDHFIRLFHQEVGETPANYIIRRKLEQAELWLVTTDKPIKNIAAALGYDDTSYFIRLFRQRIGMSPQQYREADKQ